MSFNIHFVCQPSRRRFIALVIGLSATAPLALMGCGGSGSPLTGTLAPAASEVSRDTFPSSLPLAEVDPATTSAATETTGKRPEKGRGSHGFVTNLVSGVSFDLTRPEHEGKEMRPQSDGPSVVHVTLTPETRIITSEGATATLTEDVAVAVKGPCDEATSTVTAEEVIVQPAPQEKPEGPRGHGAPGGGDSRR